MELALKTLIWKPISSSVLKSLDSHDSTLHLLYIQKLMKVSPHKLPSDDL